MVLNHSSFFMSRTRSGSLEFRTVVLSLTLTLYAPGLLYYDGTSLTATGAAKNNKPTKTTQTTMLQYICIKLQIDAAFHSFIPCALHNA